MKDQAIQFFANNSSQIWTLISVLVGGFMTYLSTSSIERYKVRKQEQKANLENILVPYCSCIEDTIEIIKKIRDLKDSDIQKIIFEELLCLLSAPLVYRRAAKQIYLSSQSRELLEKYKKVLNNFLSKLNENSKYCQHKYESCIETFLKEQKIDQNLEFFNSQFWVTDIVLTYKTPPIERFKLALIKGTEESNFTLIDSITSVEFINDEISNWDSINTIVELSEDVRKSYNDVKDGSLEISDLTPKIKNGYELIKELTEFCDKENIFKLINEKESEISKLFLEMFEILKDIEKNIKREIDKIAN